jgi:hypothetical protein
MAGRIPRELAQMPEHCITEKELMDVLQEIYPVGGRVVDWVPGTNKWVVSDMIMLPETSPKARNFVENWEVRAEVCLDESIIEMTVTITPGLIHSLPPESHVRAETLMCDPDGMVWSGDPFWFTEVDYRFLDIHKDTVITAHTCNT